MGPVASELRDRLFYLADPKVRWVRGLPQRSNQSCLLYDHVGGAEISVALTPTTETWLYDFVFKYTDGEFVGDPLWPGTDLGVDPVEFNETSSRQEVLWMLEEAVDEAIWEGV